MNRFILSFLLLFFAFHVKAQNIEQLRDSMAAGNLNYQVELAQKYIEGDSVQQDTQEAYRLIKDAAKRATAMESCGWASAIMTASVSRKT
jgi:TPR repeat protein